MGGHMSRLIPRLGIEFPAWKMTKTSVFRSLMRVLAGLTAAMAMEFLPAQAATYYVDGNCPRDGNGASIICASTSGGAGAKNNLDGGISLLSSPGDVLNIRGNHSAHDGETQGFDGRYNADHYVIAGKNGAAGKPIILQPYGYSGPGTGETVFIEGTVKPSGGWTQCTSCSSTGNCPGVTGTCADTWYATDSTSAGKVIGAQK